MDKNTLMGMLMMGLVLFGFMYCNRPDPEQMAAEQTEQAEQAAAEARAAHHRDSLDAATLTPGYMAQVATAVKTYGTRTDSAFSLRTEALDLKVASATDTVATGTVRAGNKAIDITAAFNAADTTVTAGQRVAVAKAIKAALSTRSRYGDFAQFLDAEAAQPVTLSNSKINVTFEPLGGRIGSVTLKDYKTETGETPRPVELMSPGTSDYGFTFTTADQRISTRDLAFTPTVNADSTAVTMKIQLNADTWFAVTYTLHPDSYVVSMDVTQHNMDSVIPSNIATVDFDWNYKMARNETGRTFEEQKSYLSYKLVGSSPDDLENRGDDSEKVKSAIKWVAFKNQFFSTVIIARGNFNSADLNSSAISDDSADYRGFLKDMSMAATLDYSSLNENPFAFDFYLGPNSYPGLNAVDDQLADAVNDGKSLQLNSLVYLGWGIFGWINRFLVIPIFNFLGSFIGSYGIIILILTIIIKMILFPFTYKSYMSQARMRVLAPEIKEINDKYPGQENMAKRQQETMKLYSRAGASPFSGCLPMLLQMPVLIALFWFFPSAIELRGQSFLWVHDLSAPDYICTLPFSIPFYGDKVSLFCLLMTVTNIFSTRITMQSQPQTGMGGMKWMTYMMPVMFLFFFNQYAAGLSYYYFLSLLITIIQTMVCRKVVNEDKVRKQMLENAKKPRKKSGLMARLEAAQKRQEAMMREQAKNRKR